MTEIRNQWKDIFNMPEKKVPRFYNQFYNHRKTQIKQLMAFSDERGEGTASKPDRNT